MFRVAQRSILSLILFSLLIPQPILAGDGEGADRDRRTMDGQGRIAERIGDVNPRAGNKGCNRILVWVMGGAVVLFGPYATKVALNPDQPREVVEIRIEQKPFLVELEAAGTKLLASEGPENSTAVGSPVIVLGGFASAMSPTKMQPGPRSFMARLLNRPSVFEIPLEVETSQFNRYIGLRKFKDNSTGKITTEWNLVEPDFDGSMRVNGIWLDETYKAEFPAALEASENNARDVFIDDIKVKEVLRKWEEDDVKHSTIGVVELEQDETSTSYLVFTYGRKTDQDENSSPVGVLHSIIKFPKGEKPTIEFFSFLRPGNY